MPGSIFTGFLTRRNTKKATLTGVALLIFTGTVCLYWPCTRGRFLKVDDREYLQQSVRRNGLTWNAVEWAFTSTDAYYQPLVRLSHVLDYQIWQRNAAGHHATSVVLHALNAALVFGFLWTLLGYVSLTTGERLVVGLCVAVVFAIHPLQTESVAWMAVRTQLLCTTFGIGSIWAYVAGARRPVVWGLYVAALLCKPTAVSLPFVMLAIDYFPLWRHEHLGWRRLLREKAVLFGIAGMAGLATLITELRSSGPMAPSEAVPLSVLVFRVFRCLVFYPMKLNWTSHLLPNYVSDISPGPWTVWIAVLAVAVVAAVVVMERRRTPVLAAAWGSYVMLVLPTSVPVPEYRQLVAMRYAYEAVLPLLLLVGAAGVWLWRRSAPAARGLLVGLLACELCSFAVVTRRLIPNWHDDETMRRTTLAEIPNSAEANQALATELSDQGRTSEALPYARRAVQLAPRVCEVHVVLGRVLCQLGRVPEAVEQGAQAVQLNPYSANANFGFGVALMMSGKLREAVERYEQALRFHSDFAEAHSNLGVAAVLAGRPGEAIGHFEHALRICPDRAEVQNDLGNALAQTGRIEESIPHYVQALRLKPNFAEAHFNLGWALAQSGKLGNAIGHYEQALRLKPDDAEIHRNLGNALARLGRMDRALAHCDRAVRINPDLAEAHYDLGIILMGQGKLQEAIDHFEKALRVRPDCVQAQCNLGNALLLANKPQEAIEHYEQALRIKPDYGPALKNLATARDTLTRLLRGQQVGS